MDIETRAEVAAPIEFVFEQITNWDEIERLVMRRGGEIARTTHLTPAEEGTAWDLSFYLRGKTRKMQVEIFNFQRPDRVGATFRSRPLDVTARISLTPLPSQRTRMTLTTNLRGKTIPARLLLQTLRLRRARTEKRMGVMLSGFADQIEASYRA